MTIAPCWQYVVKTKIREQKNNVPPEYDPNDLRILPLSWKVANDFIVTYEWVGNMGTSKYCFGLFFGEHLASVVCYGPLVVPSHYSDILGKDLSSSVMQLCRGASTYWAPKWASSKLISHSLKLLRKALKVKVVVAYANPETGEIGTIYQACNAYYLGETSPGGGKRYIIKGHSYDPRKVVKKFGSRSRNHLLTVDPSFKTIPIKPKHRYIFVLGSKKERKEILQRINPLVREYPKRLADIRSTSMLQTETI
ncbi:MAG: hypothetical protein JXB43_06280 [Dehalococcoidia bacterium]|nr:hypothetical protein [Dehalococcoidia bacterium]